VHKNAYATDAAEYKLPMVLAEAARSVDCFDCVAYLENSPDLPRAWDCPTLFNHYINYGQFEGRPFRYVFISSPFNSDSLDTLYRNVAPLHCSHQLRPKSSMFTLTLYMAAATNAHSRKANSLDVLH
jgi:hypothetical protein